MRHRIAFIATLAATILLGMPALVSAGDAGGSNGSGGTGGGGTGIGWNPVVHCTPEPGSTIFQLLECLAMGLDSEYGCVPMETVVGGGGGEEGSDEIAGLPRRICHEDPQVRSDYRVLLVTSPPGLDIRRREPTADGSYEPDSLLIWENDPEIQWTHLRLNRPGLEARTAQITEKPAGGSLALYVNERTIRVQTNALQTAGEVTDSLLAGLLDQGFTAFLFHDSIVISTHQYHLPRESSEITYVAFRSSDPGIQASELRLARPGIEPTAP